jgi:hypothetical protein
MIEADGRMLVAIEGESMRAAMRAAHIREVAAQRTGPE